MSVSLAVTRVTLSDYCANLLALETREEYRQELNDAGSPGEQIVHFENVDSGDLEGLLLLMGNNQSLCDAVEGLLLKAFLAGRGHALEEVVERVIGRKVDLAPRRDESS